MTITDKIDSSPKFINLLQAQIGHEFHAQQQYIAIAVWFDSQDLPELAKLFYAQAVEERNHAMMIIQYFLDRDLEVTIPGVPDVKADFTTVADPIRVALEQEKQVTEQIVTLASTARAESDYIGEQFMQWFLKEQTEEVASMTTLLNVAERGVDDLFGLETFVARNAASGSGDAESFAPSAAGGSL